MRCIFYLNRYAHLSTEELPPYVFLILEFPPEWDEPVDEFNSITLHKDKREWKAVRDDFVVSFTVPVEIVKV